MIVKLIQPRMIKRPMDTDLKLHMAPPLGLLTVAAVLRREHRVAVENENIEPVRLDDSPDIVGLSVTVDVLPRAIEIARAYRSRGIPVVAGGIHVTTAADTIPEDAFELRTAMREAVNEENFRRAVPAEGGKLCVTRCRVLRRTDRFTLLDVCPDTGRLHQIRFSLAEAGFPIVGDTLYGHDSDDPRVGRVMLHAETLRYTDPFSREPHEITAPLPECFGSIFLR